MKGQILKVIISLAVTIIVCEILLQFLGVMDTYPERSMGGNYSSMYGGSYPTWYLTGSPFETVESKKKEFTHSYNLNSEGLLFAEPKDSTQKKVFLVGDSNVFGIGASPDSSLSSNLNRIFESKEYAFLNAGFSGSDPVFGTRLIIDKLLLHRPYMVIQFITHGDFMDCYLRGGFERFRSDGKTHFISEPPCWESFYQYSRLVRGFSYLFLGIDRYLMTKKERETCEEKGAEIMLSVLMKCRIELEKQNVQYLVVALPDKFSQSNRITFLKHCNNLKPLNIINLNNLAFVSHKPNRLFWPLDSHFTPEGYAFIATHLSQILKEKILNDFPKELKS